MGIQAKNLIFVYIALKYNFPAVLFFWTSRFELAEAKYDVFRGVRKIFREKLAHAKVEKPRISR